MKTLIGVDPSVLLAASKSAVVPSVLVLDFSARAAAFGP